MTGVSSYVGRFAPSPTGPLHLGSLYTALASYLDARAANGVWFLRIDDIDIPRNASGADSAILKTLSDFGLEWDGEVYYQSRHQFDYDSALQRLTDENKLYPCICSRKSLADAGGADGIYPGFCRHLTEVPSDLSYALRIKSENRDIVFSDRLHDEIRQNLAKDHGDFIIRRKEGMVSYQLACVVDDFLQEVTHVVRGYDLIDSTPRQIYLQQLLGLPTPTYLHMPVIVDGQGQKLSKQTLAAPVTKAYAPKILFELLNLLGMQPPNILLSGSCAEIVAWGVTHWNTATLPLRRYIHAGSACYGVNKNPKMS